MSSAALRISAATLGLALLLSSLTLGSATQAAVRTGGGNFFLAPSLVQLQREVNARWPNRSRVSDGWIGDRYHRKGRSDHNPVGHRNGPRYGTRGSVHALDITTSGISTSTLLNAVIGDHRVAYVIYNGRIYSAGYGWAARAYSGDPHRTHIHISLRADSPSGARAAENDTSPWFGSGGGRPAQTPSGSNRWLGASGTAVRNLQRALIRRGYKIPAGATGYFGTQTKKAVKRFQRRQGWSGSAADGIPGPTTMRRLGLSPGGSVSNKPSRSKAPRRTSRPGTSRYSPGARGPHIKEMQRRLNRWGFTIKSGATGYFGAETRRAVRRFQQASGWSGKRASGIPGKGTLRRLGLA